MSEPKYVEPLTVSAVDDAYGNDEAVEEVAVKYPASAELPSAEEPSTDSVAYGDVVPIPTFPPSATVKCVVVAVPFVDDAIVNKGPVSPTPISTESFA